MKTLIAYLLLRHSAGKKRDLSVLEGRQEPSGAAHFNDSYYFCGRDGSGTSLVFRTGFRPSAQTELWCDLVLPGLGRLRAPEGSAPDRGGIKCGGLSFECKEPGRTWLVSYSGPMDMLGHRAHVELALTFSSSSPIVDFGIHGDSWSLARYLAGQTWSRAWLEKLRDLSQTHYEQAGTLAGRITVDGQTREVSLPAIRDHSFGPRDWKAMQRHVWLMALMEDGTQINLSLVSYDFLPYMHSGYRIANGAIQPVTRAPGFQEIPAANAKGTSFDCTFHVGREAVTLACRVEDRVEYVMNGDYAFFEGLATFSVGAHKGVGVCEFGNTCNGKLPHRPAQ